MIAVLRWLISSLKDFLRCMFPRLPASEPQPLMQDISVGPMVMPISGGGNMWIRGEIHLPCEIPIDIEGLSNAMMPGLVLILQDLEKVITVCAATHELDRMGGEDDRV